MQEIIIRAVCFTLLHSLWQGLLLAAVAALLMMLTKKSASALRYKLLCSLLVVFVAVVSVTFCAHMLSSANPAAAFTSIATVAKHSAQINQPAGTNLIFADSIHKLTNTFSTYFNQYSWLLVLIWFFLFLFIL